MGKRDVLPVGDTELTINLEDLVPSFGPEVAEQIEGVEDMLVFLREAVANDRAMSDPQVAYGAAVVVEIAKGLLTHARKRLPGIGA